MEKVLDTRHAPGNAPSVPMPSSRVPMPAPAGTEFVRKRGRPRRTADADLRSVVVGCRLDPETAEVFAARAALHGMERATLLTQLVTEEMARPAPKRRVTPQPTVQVTALAEALIKVDTTRDDLRMVHGTLRQYLAPLRETGREDVIPAMLAALDRVDALVLEVEGLMKRTETLIAVAEGRRDVVP
ncbi:hypothetical protein [Roseicella frigidaeris]|uniref:hypothetical protein n=1 Tax=Roseicella frigidaeris TaxID=2230885 RepID=UPI000FDCE4F6|nr:hypothetical protein [Roseicella frigidaeris]